MIPGIEFSVLGPLLPVPVAGPRSPVYGQIL